MWLLSAPLRRDLLNHPLHVWAQLDAWQLLKPSESICLNAQFNTHIRYKREYNNTISSLSSKPCLNYVGSVTRNYFAIQDYISSAKFSDMLLRICFRKGLDWPDFQAHGLFPGLNGLNNRAQPNPAHEPVYVRHLSLSINLGAFA